MSTKPIPPSKNNERLRFKLVAYFLAGFVLSFWGPLWALIPGLALIFFKDRTHKISKIASLIAGIVLFVFLIFPYLMENRFEKVENNPTPPQSVFPELNSIYTKIATDYPEGKLSVKKKDRFRITAVTIKHTSKTNLIPDEVVDNYGLEACNILKSQGKQLDKYVITIDTVLLPSTQLSESFPVPVVDYYSHGTRCDTWLSL